MSDAGGDASDAVRSIARSPALLEEAKSVAGELAIRAERATEEGVLAELIRLSPTYGIRDLTAGEYAELFDAYLDVLTELPLEAVRSGIREYNKSGEFFPKPGQIYTLAAPFAQTLRMAAYRAKRAAEYRDQNPPPRSDEDRARDRQTLIEQGILTPEGKVVLNFKKIDRQMPARPVETPQQMAERLRALAAGEQPIETEGPPALENIEEAI